MKVDVIIPTCRSREEVGALVDEVERTAGCPVRVLATCRPVSAAANRNLGLDWAMSQFRVMIDDDVASLPHRWVEQLVAMMLMEPHCIMGTASLLKPDGTLGPMTGRPPRQQHGASVIETGQMPTACVVLRDTPVRFDEGYVGSGWEDNDYCSQLRQYSPEGLFMICHSVRVVHLNEMKGNQSALFKQNKEYYLKKWGKVTW